MAIYRLKLSVELSHFLAEQVRCGAYPSQKAAIIAAVANEQRRAKNRAWLKKELQRGLKSKSAGTLDIEDIIRRGRRRAVMQKLHRSG